MIWPRPLLNQHDFHCWYLAGDATDLRPNGYAGQRWHGSGAEALAAICADIHDERRAGPVNLWLPAYFCGQSLRYLKSLPLQLHFYALGDDLLPDFEDLSIRAFHIPVDILLHVHYFGRVAGQVKSRLFADANNALLVEDCAHVISPIARTDWVGDYLVFSPHKHFALPQIGLALARRPFEKPDTRARARLPWTWFLRQVLRRVWRHAPSPVWRRVWTDTVEPISPVQPSTRVCRAASKCLANYSSAAKKRRDHSLRLREMLKGTTQWRPLPAPEGDEVPYLIGMLCDSTQVAQTRFKLLNQRFSLVMQWPDLPDEICIKEELAESCGHRVDCTLFFFVHQRLDTHQWLKELTMALSQLGCRHV